MSDKSDKKNKTVEPELTEAELEALTAPKAPESPQTEAPPAEAKEPEKQVEAPKAKMPEKPAVEVVKPEPKPVKKDKHSIGSFVTVNGTEYVVCGDAVVVDSANAMFPEAGKYVELTTKIPSFTRFWSKVALARRTKTQNP